MFYGSCALASFGLYTWPFLLTKDESNKVKLEEVEGELSPVAVAEEERYLGTPTVRKSSQIRLIPRPTRVQ